MALKVLTDAELAAAMSAIWGQFPFEPTFAIPKAWKAAYVNGMYFGPPLGAEQHIPNSDAVFQVFEQGLCCWAPGRNNGNASWTG